MGRNWLLLTVSGFLIAGIVFSVIWWLYGRVVLHNKPLRLRLASRIPFWRLATNHKHHKSYELLERHNV